MTKRKVETREELQAEIEKAERRRKYYEQQEKILSRKVIPKLTRVERTNRLCTRAGMLESFLVHPELLSNDQVMDLLKIAFRQKEVNTWMFFKWTFKSAAAIQIVTNTWNIVMGVFDVAQSVVNSASGVIVGDTTLPQQSAVNL